MVPAPPPFPYTYEDLQILCNRLSTVLQPWPYPNGVLTNHQMSSSLYAAYTTLDRHCHAFYEGFVLLHGGVTLLTPWTTQELWAGSVMVFSPGTIHQWQTQDQACLLLDLSFDLDHRVMTPRQCCWPVCDEILWIVLLLCDTVQAARPGWPLRANSHLGVIYATLLSLIETPAHAESTAVVLSQPPFVTRIDELLRAHLAAPLTLVTLANEVSMSARHLTRRFHAYTGMTIHARLDTLRMEQAIRLLRQTNLPIAEIAHAVGIANAAYFAHRFRQRFERSPYEFRKSEMSR